ncbi:hypothetical protein [Candidatus Sulfurimonas baltica]|uniref:Uncharacterized protein n=1 Tax=Candidatus Sulfurimonas baltica TaxID=2740404 RepID=A0A7S7RP84_9BACT|nr:hypothetical protein [Candidatus Sulfurimonas baltica]QOY53220.1 hypothetical protein HUE88_05950 [Candidatus Sulfurimonas baltica]
MEENKIMKFFKSPSFQSLATVLTFAIAFYIGYLQEVLGGLNLLIGASITTFIALMSVWIHSLYSNQKLEENFIGKIGILEDFIKANGLGSIINEKTLAIWESSASSVWVVTPDLSNDVGISNDSNIDEELVKAVHDNLLNGKKYIYFVPKSKLITGRLNEYIKKHKSAYKEGQVEFCFIPESQFHFINEVVLYDVECETQTKAVQWFPNQSLNYYLELDNHNQSYLVGILKHMIERYELKDITKV